MLSQNLLSAFIEMNQIKFKQIDIDPIKRILKLIKRNYYKIRK